MYTLFIAATKTLSLEWFFSNLGDFVRAATAARSARETMVLIDVADLQGLIDATHAPFSSTPATGSIEFRMRSALQMVEASAA